MNILLMTPALRRLLPLLLLALAAPAGFGQTASPPNFMAYQSYLTDGSGNPLGGTNTGPKNYDVVFRLWNIQTGGTTNGANELYAEQQTVTVNNGYFSVLLGEGSQYSNEPHTNNLSGLFTGATASSRFIDMTVLGIGAGNANVTIAPRTELLTAPYAFLAANAVNAASAGSLVNNNNTTQVVTVTNGFVGIGTNPPSGPLEVSGGYTSPPLLTLDQSFNSWSSSNLFNSFRFITTTTADAFTDGPFRQFNVSPGGVSIGYPDTPSYGSLDALFVNGNVGINTTNTTATLTVNGSANVSGILVAGATTVSGLTTTGTAQLNGTVNANGGQFNIYSPGNSPYLYVDDSTHGNSLTLGLASSAGSWSTSAALGDAVLRTSGGKLLLQSGSGSSAITISTANNVGIGTTTPSQPLEVAGNAQVDGSLSANGINSSGGLFAVGGVNPTTQGAYIQWNAAGLTNLNGEMDFRNQRGLGTGGFVFQNYYNNNTVESTPLVITGGGYVGIGTTTPGYPLDVELAGPSVSTSQHGYLAGSGYGDTANVVSTAVGFYCASRILCGSEVDATSDGRVKEIIGRSDTRKDLAAVRQLQITDYRKIDKVQFGGRLEKGVIAQEVESIVPGAVATNTDYIPNIYSLAKSIACTNQNLWVTMGQPHGLKVGDMVKLMADTGESRVAVTAVQSPQVFAVAQPASEPKQLFVFGKQVGDFRSVNYDRLFTTGLGAIQELAKRTDQWEAQNAQVAELKQQVTDLRQQMADMKKLVTQLAEATKNSKLAVRAVETTGATVAATSSNR